MIGYYDTKLIIISIRNDIQKNFLKRYNLISKRFHVFWVIRTELGWNNHFLIELLLFVV